MKTSQRVLSILAMAVLIIPVESAAQLSVPEAINVQAIVRDSNGDPVNMSYMGADVTLYTAEADGDSAWAGKANILIEDGLTSFTLPVDSNVFEANADLWLEIGLTADLKVARRKITSAPYAYYADQAGSCTTLNGNSPNYYLDASNLSAGTLNTSRYDAYDQLSTAGRLDNNNDADLLTRTQADSRFVDTTTDSMTGDLTVAGQVSSSRVRVGSSAIKTEAYLWSEFAAAGTSCERQCQADADTGKGGVCLVAYDHGGSLAATRYLCSATGDNKLCICVGLPGQAF